MAITTAPLPILVADTEAERPATIGANQLILCKDTGRLYQFAGGVYVASDEAVTDSVDALPTLTSGTYTPTRSAETNIDGTVTTSEAQYLRVGSAVTVSGRFTANPTLAAVATSFELTLPVASNIGAAEDLSGIAFCGGIAGLGAAITGSVANNTAVVSWIAGDITSNLWSYVFTYSVI